MPWMSPNSCRGTVSGGGGQKACIEPAADQACMLVFWFSGPHVSRCRFRMPEPCITSMWMSRVIIEPQVLHQLRNVSKGDVPMALLPDPTTAASERSSVKNRLTGSRRRGSGINRHRSRTVSKPSLRGRHRVQAHPGGVQGQSLCNQP